MIAPSRHEQWAGIAVHALLTFGMVIALFQKNAPAMPWNEVLVCASYAAGGAATLGQMGLPLKWVYAEATNAGLRPLLCVAAVVLAGLAITLAWPLVAARVVVLEGDDEETPS